MVTVVGFAEPEPEPSPEPMAELSPEDGCESTVNSQERGQSEGSRRARIPRTSPAGSCRTKVGLYRLLRPLWERKFSESRFFKLRVINRRFNRKLSEEGRLCPKTPERKISWDEQVEFVVFSKSQKPNAVAHCPRHHGAMLESVIQSQ
jgi:hypothetical protein